MATANPYKKNQTQDYLKALDERLRLNRGGFNAVGTDVNPTAFRLQGKQMAQPILPGSRAYTPVQNPAFPQGMDYGYDMGQAPSNQPSVINLINEIKSKTEAKPTGETTQNVVIDINGQQVPLPDGGQVYSDGSVHYSTGEIINTTNGTVTYEPEIVTRFSDNYFIGKDGNFYRYEGAGTFDNTPQSLVYGQNANQAMVSQGYGNANQALYGAGTHRGVDIAPYGGSNLPIALPFAVEVVASDNQGDPRYGNSVLVRIPSTGEMLRISHMMNPSSFRPGDVIGANQTLGLTGSTGYSTGVHTDLEYYDANGQISDPSNFLNSLDANKSKAIGISTSRYTQIQPQDLPQNIQREASEYGYMQSRQPAPQQSSVEANQRVLQGREVLKPEPGFSQKPTPQEAFNINKERIPGQVADAVSDVAGGQVNKLASGVASLGQKTGLPELKASETLNAVGNYIKDPIKQGKIEGQVDLGATEALNKLGIQTTQGKMNVNTPLGQFNVPDLGISEKVGSLNNYLQNKLANINAPVGNKVGIEQSGATSEGNIESKTTIGQGLRDTIGEVLGNASGIVENLKAGTAVQPVYAEEANPQDQPAGTQLTKDASISASEANTPTEKTYNIRSIGMDVPESQMSGLFSRLYGLQEAGKGIGESKKAAKLYQRFQEMKNRIVNKLPANLSPSAINQAVIQALSGSTPTGYINESAEAKAQAEKKAKEQYYQSKGVFSGMGDVGSYDKALSYLKENNVSVPSSLASSISKTANVNPYGSGVQYSNQYGGDQLSNVGTQSMDWGKLDSNFIDVDSLSKNNLKVNKKVSGFTGDLFKKLNPFRKRSSW